MENTVKVIVKETVLSVSILDSIVSAKAGKEVRRYETFTLNGEYTTEKEMLKEARKNEKLGDIFEKVVNFIVVEKELSINLEDLLNHSTVTKQTIINHD